MGVDVRELFRAPYRAQSLKEFWGKRWNIAFSEMTGLIAYRPLKQVISANTAMLASFLLSGLLHEIAISLPVRAGYGLPFLYFVIHGMLMYAESHSAMIQRITTHSFWSHVWVIGWLVVPMPLLFHAQFIAQVLKPLRDLLLPM
jgi:D-alanyl-lipoteichoic acid acyltransferase DltB (MBOAT superfamily)